MTLCVFDACSSTVLHASLKYCIDRFNTKDFKPIYTYLHTYIFTHLFIRPKL